MTEWLSFGLLFSYAAIVWILIRFRGVAVEGETPVSPMVFVAILFTSGLDVGLIMFPLMEFPLYANTDLHPEYAFSNPLALEFGFWGVMVWSIYFLTCSYFCLLEPKIRLFEKPIIKWAHNLVVIGTCAFTAYLLLTNLPSYLPADQGQWIYYLIVFACIFLAILSSTDVSYVKKLSVSSTYFFFLLIAALAINGASQLLDPGDVFWSGLIDLGNYLLTIDRFLLPMNDHHEFYLYWWLAWSIMIGQFIARFASGLKPIWLLLSILIVPSLPIAVWFTVLYGHYVHNLAISSALQWAMVVVGIVFVINSLDSLIRLYTDNLNVTINRLGKAKYIAGNFVLLGSLVLMYQLDFLEIQWIGAAVILMFLVCAGAIMKNNRDGINFP